MQALCGPTHPLADATCDIPASTTRPHQLGGPSVSKRVRTCRDAQSIPIRRTHDPAGAASSELAAAVRLTLIALVNRL